ncbi:hypothetical protein J3F83DRAFT_764881 [Trichoderma novae-zelandiae]
MSNRIPRPDAIFREPRSSERVVFAFAWSWAAMGRPIDPSYPLGCRPISLPAHSAAASLGLERRSGGDLFTLVPPKIQRQGHVVQGKGTEQVSVMMIRERQREKGRD